MRKHTSPFRRRSQHIGVLSDDMWMAHGRNLAGATKPHLPLHDEHLKEQTMGRRALDYLAMHTVEANGCWLFTGRLTPKGYGSAGSHGQAHRYYYTRLIGPIPECLTIDHLCFTPRCVNPAHMEPVTVRENTRRARARRDGGRLSCKMGHALTPENTYIYPTTGYRECRTCRSAYVRQFKSRRRAKAAA